MCSASRAKPQVVGVVSVSKLHRVLIGL
uniref:Uncharacterized protein n=1 Tax=Arundo donax TaxID=35708 RepID=A0A0A9ANQ3_ARUDO